MGTDTSLAPGLRTGRSAVRQQGGTCPPTGRLACPLAGVHNFFSAVRFSSSILLVCQLMVQRFCSRPSLVPPPLWRGF